MAGSPVPPRVPRLFVDAGTRTMAAVTSNCQVHLRPQGS